MAKPQLKGMRALLVERLSELTNETTSPHRQREINVATANARGFTVVGMAQDLDVSASKVRPMDRPELGDWLRNRSHEFDVIIFWRIDRLARRVSDFADMIKWADEHGKNLISATESFDLSTPIGRAIAYLIAIFAEMEAAAIRERVTGAHAYLRSERRWASGHPVYGYRTVPHPGGSGYAIEIDESAAEVVRDIVDRVIKGQSAGSLPKLLNERGVPSPRDHHRLAQGKPLKNIPWSGATIRKLLRSEAILGHMIHNGNVVNDKDGMPVARASALISEATWEQLQNALNSNAKTKKRSLTPSMLLNVAKCGVCGQTLYRWGNGVMADGITPKAYYRCRSVNLNTESGGDVPKCENRLIRADDLEAIVEDSFLAAAGELEVMERVYVAGEDHTEELARVRRALNSVRDEKDAGQYDYPGGESEYGERIQRLSERIKRLSAVPTRPAGYQLVPTGRTYGAEWEEAGDDSLAKRALLMRSGVTIKAVCRVTGRISKHQARPIEVTLDWPEDLGARLHEK